MLWKEVINISLDICVLGLVYTFVGLSISYLFYYLFDEFNEEWMKKSDTYKVTDVIIEVISIPLLTFWMLNFIRPYAILLPVPNTKKVEIEMHVVDILFMVTIFIFLDDTVEKLQYLHNYYFHKHAANLLPQYGSLADLSLSY